MSSVPLGPYVADLRLRLFDDLRAGREPSQGSFDPTALKEAKVKGAPQMGSTRYEPNAIHLEFIFPDPGSVASVFAVTLTPPERIVFLPVPAWVVENIWQGDVAGSFHFESDAMRLANEFLSLLEPAANRPLFEPAAAKRRE